MDRTGLDEVALVAQALFGAAQLQVEFGQVAAAAVLELDALEQVPDPLVRIEVGRVAGQAFQVEALRRAAREEILDRLPLVDRRSVPDDQDLAAQLARASRAGSPRPLRR